MNLKSQPNSPSRVRRRAAGALWLLAPFLAIASLTALAAGCGGGGGGGGSTPDPLPSVRVVPSPSPTATPSPTPSATPTPSPSPTPSTITADPNLAGFEQEAVNAVNQLRQQNGLPALQISEQLTQAARLHSKDMAENNYFAHNDPSGKGVAGRATDQGYAFDKIGENILYVDNATDPGAFAVNAWGESPDHRAALLDPEFTQIGVGLWRSGDRVYCTAVMATP